MTIKWYYKIIFPQFNASLTPLGICSLSLLEVMFYGDNLIIVLNLAAVHYIKLSLSSLSAYRVRQMEPAYNYFVFLLGLGILGS